MPSSSETDDGNNINNRLTLERLEMFDDNSTNTTNNDNISGDRFEDYDNSSEVSTDKPEKAVYIVRDAQCM